MEKISGTIKTCVNCEVKAISGFKDSLCCECYYKHGKAETLMDINFNIYYLDDEGNKCCPPSWVVDKFIEDMENIDGSSQDILDELPF